MEKVKTIEVSIFEFSVTRQLSAFSVSYLSRSVPRFLCSRLSFLEVILSVLSFGNFFHLMWLQAPLKVCSLLKPMATLSLWLKPPIVTGLHCLLTMLLLLTLLVQIIYYYSPSTCDEFPFLYFAQHWYKRHITSSITICLYLCFNNFSLLLLLLESCCAPFRPLQFSLQAQPGPRCGSAGGRSSSRVQACWHRPALAAIAPPAWPKHKSCYEPPFVSHLLFPLPFPRSFHLPFLFLFFPAHFCIRKWGTVLGNFCLLTI